MLEQRIAAALQPDTAVTAADVAALIEEAEAAIAKAEKDCEVDQTLALDPKAARQAVADATFAANRLRTLLSQLQARYQQLQYQDQVMVWHADADVRERERDALSEELCEVYPEAMAQIVALLRRIIANHEALSALDQARPAGVIRHLLSAELHARGLDGFTRDMPSLLTAVHLIDWETGRPIWPPPKPSMASAFAAIAMPGCDRRFTGDWAKHNERRAAAQQRERQHMADYYARTTKEQEDRENAEARESFMEQQQRLSVNRPLKS
jgi:hypothetical protein